MRAPVSDFLDLMPPDFSEGLEDWSRGDGTPDSPTYETADHVRIATGDPHFGTCLEMRKVEPIQRLRYMAELPIRPGAFVEVRTRIRVLRGPLPGARIAASPGGAHGRLVPDLPTAGPIRLCPQHDLVTEVCGVIGPCLRDGVDLVWDGRVLYAHVGLDLVGPTGGVVRIERLAVSEVTDRYRAA
jgi:hypothetical protein